MAFTTTVAAAVVVPTPLVAESVYVVVVRGETVSELPLTVPVPLTLVAIAFETTHERMDDCPAVSVVGVAVNDPIVGALCGTVAEQVDVATVDDASVAWMVVV